MNPRQQPCAEPPDRAPYFKIIAPAGIFWFRAPSLPRISAILSSISEERRNRLIGLLSQVTAGRSALAVLFAAHDVLPLFTALIGECWADHAWALDSVRVDGEDFGEYGARVYEELHEAGWSVESIFVASFAIMEHVRKASEISAEVTARTAFFQRPKANGTVSELPLKPDTSDAGEADPSMS